MDLSRIPRCRAKIPNMCRFHTAVIRMEKAAANGDLDAYFEARTQVEEDILLRWNDDRQKHEIDFTKTVVDSTITVPKIIEALQARWDKHFEEISEAEKIWYKDRFEPKPYMTLLATNIDEDEFNAKYLPSYNKEGFEVAELGTIKFVDGYWGESDKVVERVWFVFTLGGKYFMVEGVRDPVTQTRWPNDPVEVEYNKVVKAVINSVVKPLK